MGRASRRHDSLLLPTVPTHEAVGVLFTSIWPARVSSCKANNNLGKNTAVRGKARNVDIRTNVTIKKQNKTKKKTIDPYILCGIGEGRLGRLGLLRSKQPEAGGNEQIINGRMRPRSRKRRRISGRTYGSTKCHVWRETFSIHPGPPSVKEQTKRRVFGTAAYSHSQPCGQTKLPLASALTLERKSIPAHFPSFVFVVLASCSPFL